jgi:hypothetical protein
MASSRDRPSPGVARRFWLIALVVAAAGALALGLVLFDGLLGGGSGEDAATAAKPAPAGGCRLSESSSGYPADYLRRAVPSGRHPPQPAPGWHQPTEPVRFDKLFHSVFHGYLVITYRPELPRAERAKLRQWVRAHRGARIVGSPDATRGAPLIELVEWGWQLRCADAVPSIAEVARFAARRALNA